MATPTPAEDNSLRKIFVLLHAQTGQTYWLDPSSTSSMDYFPTPDRVPGTTIYLDLGLGISDCRIGKDKNNAVPENKK